MFIIYPSKILKKPDARELLRDPIGGLFHDPPFGDQQSTKPGLRCAYPCLLFPPIRIQASLIRLVENNKTPAFAGAFVLCGERGIRTPGTLYRYGSLANCWFQPLTHLSNCVELLLYPSNRECKYNPRYATTARGIQ